jgi:hypothetical protein
MTLKSAARSQWHRRCHCDLCGLVPAHKVVGDGARVAEVRHGLPVPVDAARAPLDHQADELGEGHVVHGRGRRRGPAPAEAPGDEAAEAGAVVGGFGAEGLELALVCGEEALEWVADEDELGVALEAAADLRGVEAAQGDEHARVMHSSEGRGLWIVELLSRHLARED